MFGFGKKKIYEEVITDSFVRALIDDMKDAFPWLFEQLDELPIEKSILRSFPENSHDIIAVANLSLELISLPNLFQNDQAKRLREIAINLFTTHKEIEKEKLLIQIESYERCFNENIEAGLNPITAVSEMLYKNLGLKDFQSQQIPKLKGPDPILVEGLSLALTSFSGRWKKLKESYKIVKSKT